MKTPSWFQSTHSLRSATGTPTRGAKNRLVSIHALLAECDGQQVCQVSHQHRFNPRTPCGVRLYNQNFRLQYIEFQSTHSLRSATADCGAHQEAVPVSIHALLAECDKTATAKPLIS